MQWIRLIQLIFYYRVIRYALWRKKAAVARTYIQKGIEVFRFLSFSDDGIMLEYLGHADLLEKQYHHAQEHFKQSLVLMQDSLDMSKQSKIMRWVERRRKSALLYKLGDALQQTGELQESIEIYKQSLVLVQELNNRHREVTILIVLGNNYEQLGDIEQAKEQYEKALEIMLKTRNRLSRGVLSKLGDISLQIGKIQQAKEYYERALIMTRKSREHKRESILLAKLGDILSQQGDINNAKQYYEEYIVIMRKFGDRQQEGVTISRLGDILLQQDDVNGARRNYEEYLAIMREIEERHSECYAFGKLAQVDERLGNIDQAEQEYRQSLQIILELKMLSDIANVQETFADFLIRQRGNQEKSEAKDLLEEAVTIYRQLGNARGIQRVETKLKAV